MQQSRNELNSYGIIGYIVYWSRLLAVVMCFAQSILGFYWMIVTGTKFWSAANGTDLMITLFFASAFSIVAFCVGLLCIFQVFRQNDPIIGYVFSFLAAFSLLLNFVAMSRTTETKSSLFEQNAFDYCARKTKYDFVGSEFCRTYPIHTMKSNYIQHRCFEMYCAMAGISSSLAVALVVCILSSCFIPQPIPANESGILLE